MIDRLRAAVGHDGVAAPHQVPAFAVAGVLPRAVVTPPTVDAAAAVFALCSEQGWPVEPAGAGTWLAAGRPPDQPPVVISTTRLRRIREYVPADLVVGVEAGVPLDELQQHVARHRQTVPLDPPGGGAGTLAATAALAAAGPLRAAHGSPRDMVLGVEIVTGDGRVLHFGGRVVKNVAGYDITRLLVGSRGSFALITALHVRLRGLPDFDRTLCHTVATLDEAAAAAGQIRQRMEPDALELLDPALGAALLPGTRLAGWSILARFRGSTAAVDEAEHRFRQILPDTRTLPAAAAADLWYGLAADEAAAPLVIRFAHLPAQLTTTVRAVVAAIASNRRSDNEMSIPSEWHIAAHAANGIVRLWRPPRADAAVPISLAGALRDSLTEIVSSGGTVTWPIIPGDLASALGAPPPRPVAEQRILQELKQRFDPAGILSPGRHLAGL